MNTQVGNREPLAPAVFISNKVFAVYRRQHLYDGTKLVEYATGQLKAGDWELDKDKTAERSNCLWNDIRAALSELVSCTIEEDPCTVCIAKSRIVRVMVQVSETTTAIWVEAEDEDAPEVLYGSAASKARNIMSRICQVLLANNYSFCSIGQAI